MFSGVRHHSSITSFASSRLGGNLFVMTDLQRAIARMFVVGFDGHAVTDDMKRYIDRGIGGVIFFNRNIRSAEQFNTLSGDLKRHAAGRPLLACLDHEGGRVVRASDDVFTPVPSMRAIGMTGDAALARQIGELFAGELRSVNVDVNFAPVMDVDTNPANPVIADRSFSRYTDVVSKLGVALIDGMQAGGVAACAKHFPGHGDTSQDSHLDLPRLPHNIERLEAVELAPFKASVRAGVASIMTAHVIFEPLDAKFPATMSRPVLDGILRDRFGFEGVVFSDCLQMNAIAQHFGEEQAVVRGANAGVDSFLVCHDANVQAKAIDALARAVATGAVPEARVWQANERLERMCGAYCLPPRSFARYSVDPTLAERLEQLTSGPAGLDPTLVNERKPPAAV
jgi:beta-N-acetylhexosaminidase